MNFSVKNMIELAGVQINFSAKNKEMGMDNKRKVVKREVKELIRSYGYETIDEMVNEIHQEPKLPDDLCKLMESVGESESWKPECFYYAVFDGFDEENNQGEKETILVFVTKWEWFYEEIPYNPHFRLYDILPDIGEYDIEQALYIYYEIKDGFREILTKAGFEENSDMRHKIKKVYCLK